ncbi:MAG: hypothetical protein Q8P18_02925 [Pseudomonadota bacterium]|nr:hypothetical protein [Pseudomonadota bacterium]
MSPSVRVLLDRLAGDPAFADAYFADPDPHLSTLNLDPADRSALRRMDREAVEYLAAAPSLEPERAPEYGAEVAPRRGPTILIALWGCVAWVILWRLAGPM